MTNNSKDKPKSEMFTFGEPIAMMDKNNISNYTESRWNGRYYETPINLAGLAKSQHSSPYHASAMAIKRNVLTRLFKPHPLLSRPAFMRFTQDFILFGDGYFERHENLTGSTTTLQYRPSKYVRRGKHDDEHIILVNNQGWHSRIDIQEFKRGSVFQLSQPDSNQEIYGSPEYLSALQSAWLGEAATLYRRKYYAKGHSGYILYMTDAAQEEGDIARLRKKMKESRGLDAFRNLFMYAPNGQKDGIQVIPLADALTKDDFFNIKNATREEILAAHRVPPQLMSIIPINTSGLGDANTAMEVFVQMEIMPLMNMMMGLNEWMGDEVVRFSEWKQAT